MKKNLAIVVDGNNYLWRAHYALPYKENKHGEPINAVVGFFNILTADIRKLNPTHIAVVFDASSGSAWRKDLLPGYKGNRDKGDGLRDAVYGQMPLVKSILKAFGIKVIVKSGVEADDTMGTLARMFSSEGVFTAISTTDKDIAQVVTKNVVRLEPTTRRFLGVRETVEKFGVKPSRIIDLLMLMGDKSDSVPGVPGVAMKTAASLLKRHGSVNGILESLSSLTPSKRKAIEKASKKFHVTRKVLTIDCSVNIKTRVTSMEVGRIKGDLEATRKVCRKHDVMNVYHLLDDLRV